MTHEKHAKKFINIYAYDNKARRMVNYVYELVVDADDKNFPKRPIAQC